MSVKNILVGVGLLVGATAGGTAVGSAVFSPDGQDEVTTQVIRDAPKPIILPITSGAEAQVFSDGLDGLKSSGAVSIESVSDASVIVTTKIDDWAPQTEFSRETILTGLAYGAVGREDSTFLVFGLVPDEVDTVELGGKRVPIVGNTWQVEVASSAVTNLRVGNSAADRWVVLD